MECSRTVHCRTQDELEWGARTAWRNAPRCPARVVWKRLTVFDKVGDTDDFLFLSFTILATH